MPNFLFKHKYKKIVQEFIVRMQWTQWYINDLKTDHDHDEMCEQMMLYTDMIKRKTKLSLNWPDPDNWRDIESSFRGAIATLDFCKANLWPNDAWGDDKYKMIKKYVSAYGKFTNHEELLLKANITCDKKMVDALS